MDTGRFPASKYFCLLSIFSNSLREEFQKCRTIPLWSKVGQSCWKILLISVFESGRKAAWEVQVGEEKSPATDGREQEMSLFCRNTTSKESFHGRQHALHKWNMAHSCLSWNLLQALYSLKEQERICRNLKRIKAMTLEDGKHLGFFHIQK